MRSARLERAGPQPYTATARTLHWLSAVLIVAGFLLGLSMVDLPFSPVRLRWYAWHKWIGITVLGLAVVRLVWRAGHPPPPPVPMPLWQHRAAAAVHGFAYALTLAVPLTGWMFSSAKGVPTVYLGWVRLPDLVTRDEALASLFKQVHFSLNMVLAAVVILHVAAGLKHWLIDRDGTLGRMRPWPVGRG
jgi:cytochrome b561